MYEGVKQKDPMMVASGALIAIGGVRGTSKPSVGTTTVGRWMSKTELETMQKTGRIVESWSTKTDVSVNPK